MTSTTSSAAAGMLTVEGSSTAGRIADVEIVVPVYDEEAGLEPSIRRLHDYLSALTQEVHATPVRHVDAYGLTLAPSDVPSHPSVRLGAAAGEAWRIPVAAELADRLL